MKNINPNSPCSICQKNIEETGHSLAHREGLCQSCFELCGFTPTTPTNCLSVGDIEGLLQVKRVTVADAIEARDKWEELIKEEKLAAEAVALAESLALANSIDNKTREELARQNQLANNVAINQEIATQNQEIVAQNQIDTVTAIADTSPENILSSYPQEKQYDSGEALAINDADSPLSSPPKINAEVSEKGKLSQGMSAEKFFSEDFETLKTDDEPEPNKQKLIFKIAIIVFVSVVTIFMVSSFLPDGFFSQKNNVISIAQGENNQYAMTPKPEKAGYIYILPQGTYKVVMSKESAAPKGTVSVESDKVAPTTDGKGHYENIKTIELLPGESNTITVKEGEHIYTSIHSVMEFEKQ
ncbi:MAG: hypothetical protein RR233_04540 [Clostridiales bacterium]